MDNLGLVIADAITAERDRDADHDELVALSAERDAMQAARIRYAEEKDASFLFAELKCKEAKIAVGRG